MIRGEVNQHISGRREALSPSTAASTTASGSDVRTALGTPASASTLLGYALMVNALATATSTELGTNLAA
jgi:hypothetical protein